MHRRFAVLPLAIALVAVGAVALAAVGVRPPGSAELAGYASDLAAPEMEGRASAAPGGERAARYIADRLAAAGLKPAVSGSYFQPVVVGSRLRPGTPTSLERLGPRPSALELGRDWMPHGGSLAADVSGEIVFVRYGLSPPDWSDDDYAGVDVRGKIALALDGAPSYMGDVRPTRLEKLVIAHSHGAAALVIAADSLPTMESTASSVRIVAASVTRSAADALLASAGLRLSALSSRGGHGPIATGIEARIRVSFDREERRADNVIGILPGTDPAAASDAIVLGAHYDHLGRAGGVVHPGADDNASGTAVVLGLGRAFAAAGGAPRTLIFALFTGEEIGLLGSAHYTRHPVWPLDRTAAMLNFDMVGRMRNDRLDVSGVESGVGLRALVTGAATAEALDVVVHGGPFGPSDHAPFYTAGVPVLFFHTGTHDDYHGPGDTADKLNASGMARVARLGALLVERLAEAPRPSYVKVAPTPSGTPMTGARGGAFLGVSVDGRSESDGVRLGSVIAGSAAERAGLRDGDVIVRLDGAGLERFEDLRRALSRRQPGDRVTLVYLRDGEERRTTAVLDARP